MKYLTLVFIGEFYSFGRRGILCGDGGHSRKGGCGRYDER